MTALDLVKAGYSAPVLRNARYSDLENYNRPGIRSFKNEHGNLFLDIDSSTVYSTTDPIGVMRVYENSGFAEADEILRRSDLSGNPHEVLTIRIYRLDRATGTLSAI